MKRPTFAILVAVFVSACSSGNSSSTGQGGTGTGGRSQVSTGNGGTTGSAGTPATGGSVGSGGSSSAGSGGAGSGGTGSGGTGSGGTGSGGAGSGGAGSGGSIVTGAGGLSSSGGVSATGGTRSSTSTGGTVATGGSTGGAATGGASAKGGTVGSGGVLGSGGVNGTGGTAARSGGAGGSSPGTGGGTSTGGSTGACSGPLATFSGPLSTGIIFMDDQGNRVNAHGGGIIKDGDTYYLHGEYFLSTTTNNDFNGFSMYSSKDMATWKWEKMILPQQPACPTLPPTGTCGVLGPVTKGERPHIIKCPATGEFVLFAHAASEDYQTWKEVIYATSSTVNGQYTLKGALTNASGAIASHSDMSAITDGNNAYVITESGHVYTLSTDCHSWLSDKSFGNVNGTSTGGESPTIFKAGSTYYWIMSNKTGWRANNNFYSTAPAVTGPWTYQGYIAPVTDTSNTISDQRTWLSQSTWVMPVTGCSGTTYVYWGDHWDGTTNTTPTPGQHNYLTGYVFQPIVFTGTAISLPAYLDPWKLDVGAGTWSQ